MKGSQAELMLSKDEWDLACNMEEVRLDDLMAPFGLDFCEIMAEPGILQRKSNL